MSDDTRTFADEASSGAGRQQVLLVVGGLVVVLAALWFLLLGGGGDDSAEDAAPPPVATEPSPDDGGILPTPDGGGGGRGRDDDGPPETFEVFASRDPFEPLVDTTPDGGGGDGGGGDGDTGDGDGDDGNGDTGDGDTGDGDTGDGDTGDGTGDAPSTGDPDDTGGHRVTLVNVFAGADGERAQVNVDGTVYTVSEGERFAENFQLESVDGGCATLLFGDDEFTLCEGEQIVK